MVAASPPPPNPALAAHGDVGAGAAALRRACTELGFAVTSLTDHAALAPSRLYGWSVLDVLTHAALQLQHFHDLTDTTVHDVTLSVGGYLASVSCLRCPREGHLGEVESTLPISELLRVRRIAAGYRDPDYLLAHLHVTLRGMLDVVGHVIEARVVTDAGVVRVADACLAWAAEVTAWHRAVVGVTPGDVVHAPSATSDRLAHEAFQAAGLRSAWESLTCRLTARAASSSPGSVWASDPLTDLVVPGTQHTQHRAPQRLAVSPRHPGR